MNQRVVGDEVRIERRPPGVDRHVDDHLFRAGHARVVDQVVDPAKHAQRLGRRLRDQCVVGHVDAGDVLDAIRRAVVPDLDQLIDDPRPHLGQLCLAARDEHHPRAGHGQESRDLAADAGRGARHQRDLAKVHAHQAFHPAERRPPRAGRLGDRFGQIQVHLSNPPSTIDEPRRLSRGKRQRLGFLAAPADDLIAPLHPAPRAGPGLLGGLVPPDANQLFYRGAQHVGVGVARAVVAIAQKDRARVQPERIAARAPVARERARDRQRAGELALDEISDVRVARLGQRRLKVFDAERRENDRAPDDLWGGVEDRAEHLGLGPVEPHRMDPMVRAGGLERGDGGAHLDVGGEASSTRAPQRACTRATASASPTCSPAATSTAASAASTVRRAGRETHVLRLSWRTAIPWVISKLWPLIAADSSEPRKTIMAATSPTVGNVRSGGPPSRVRDSVIMPKKSAAVAPSVAPRIVSIALKTVRMRSLSIGPGNTVFTRTPRAPSCPASWRDSALSAALGMTYAARP